MQNADDPKTPVAHRFLILVTFVAVLTGAAIALAGVAIGAHISAWPLRQQLSVEPSQQQLGPSATASSGPDICTPG